MYRVPTNMHVSSTKNCVHRCNLSMQTVYIIQERREGWREIVPHSKFDFDVQGKGYSVRIVIIIKWSKIKDEEPSSHKFEQVTPASRHLQWHQHLLLLVQKKATHSVSHAEPSRRHKTPQVHS